MKSDRHKKRLLEEIRKSLARKIESLGEICLRAIDYIGQRRAGIEFPFGFTALDRKLHGLHRQEMIVYGARPGQGKTAFALNVAWNLVKLGKRVLFLSLEMSKESLAERLICIAEKINNQLLRSGVLTDDDLRKIQRFTENLPLNFLIVNAGYRLEEVEVLVTDLNPRPDVVIIDYVQMITMQGYGSRQEAVAEYTRGLYELAHAFNFAVFVCSQISRLKGATDRPLSMDYLKWSGVLEENADVVLLASWKYALEEEANPNEYEILIAKNRHGDLGKVRLRFEPQYYSFSEMKTKQKGCKN